LFRSLSILLIFSYFLGTLGLKVNQHFCCGKLVAIELLLGQKPKDCSGKVPKEPKKCCKDEVKILQSDDAKQTFSSILIHSSFSFVSINPFIPFYEPLHQKLEELLLAHLPNGPPPGSNSRPLFLMQRSFLI